MNSQKVRVLAAAQAARHTQRIKEDVMSNAGSFNDPAGRELLAICSVCLVIEEAVDVAGRVA